MWTDRELDNSGGETHRREGVISRSRREILTDIVSLIELRTQAMERFDDNEVMKVRGLMRWLRWLKEILRAYILSS